MIWKGKNLDTIGQLFDAVYDIYKRKDYAEASDFMTHYRMVNPAADANIGYIAGYASAEDMSGILRMFGTSHPIFGSAV